MIMKMMKPGDGRGKNEREEDEEVWVMEEEGARRLIRIEHKLFVPWHPDASKPNTQSDERRHLL